mgnify:CR=1 FL=1
MWKEVLIKCNKQNERGSENETKENMVRNTNCNSGLRCDSRNLSWRSRDSFYIRKDGCKIYFEDGFVICRFSGTEPLLRIFAESTSAVRAKDYINTIKKFVFE